MLTYLLTVIIVALAITWLRVLASKRGWIEYAETHFPPLLAEWASCAFCTSFWIASAVGFVLMFFPDHGWTYLFLGVLVSPIVRLMS